MRVLVTGHGGYIGTVLVPMFLEAGHEVVGLDTHLYRSCTFGAEPVAIPEIVKIFATLRPRTWKALTPSCIWPLCPTIP